MYNFIMEQSYKVFIEIPKETKNNKYERKPGTNEVALDFVFENLTWPFNYGEIENTKGGDGDALDALVFSSAPLKQALVAECVPFGVMLSLDRGEVDDKIMMVPADDDLINRYRDISDISKQMKQELTDFYMEIARQKKKVIEVLGFRDKKSAIELIKNSQK